MRVTKRQIAGVFQEIRAHSTYKRRGGGLTEAFGACFRRRGAESGVESFEESSCLVILLRDRSDYSSALLYIRIL